MPFLFFVPVVFVAFCCWQPSALIKTASFLSFIIPCYAASSLLCSLSPLLPFPSHFFVLFYLFLLLDHHSFFLILYHPSLFCILSYSGSSFLVLLSPFVPLVNFFFGLYHLSLSLVIFVILYHLVFVLLALSYPLAFLLSGWHWKRREWV